MTDHIDDRLRESLSAMSRPVDGHPSLAMRALDEVASGRSTRAHGPHATDARAFRWTSRVPSGVSIAAIACFCLLVFAVVVGPNLSGQANAPVAANIRDQSVRGAADKIDDVLDTEMLASKAAPRERLGDSSSDRDGVAGRANAFADAAPAPAPAAPEPAQLSLRDDSPSQRVASKAVAAEAAAGAAAPPEFERQAARTIIRTGSCDIRVDDVDAARRTVESLVRPDLGEYISDSSIDLARFTPRAVLTVRIAADRFEAFSEALAGVGDLRNLSVSAVDATDQLVDLGARLRNERSVERELQGLLADRPDADLEDVMRVRRELGSVRETIERLDALHQSLRDRAAYSTMKITLIGPTPEGWLPDTDRATVGHRLADAFRGGWRTCVSSFVWLVEVFVSGLMWWVIAAILIWISARHFRWTSTWR